MGSSLAIFTSGGTRGLRDVRHAAGGIVTTGAYAGRKALLKKRVVELTTSGKPFTRDDLSINVAAADKILRPLLAEGLLTKTVIKTRAAGSVAAMSHRVQFTAAPGVTREKLEAVVYR